MSTGGVDQGGYRYTAFGETYDSDPDYPAPTGIYNLPIRWKGAWLMYSTGSGASRVDLYDMRARWWWPQGGVFVQIDDFDYGSQSNTLWAWPNQNPVRLQDFSGHDATTNNPVQDLLNAGWLPPGLALFGRGVQQRAKGISELASDSTFEQGMRDLHCGSKLIAGSAGVLGSDAAVISGIAEMVSGAARLGAEGVAEAAEVAETAEEESATLYRGVSEDHPGFADATEGTVYPRGGDGSVFDHNLGDTRTEFTSWTSDPATARAFATRGGGPGIVLEVKVSPSSIYLSPDEFGESEFLLWGPS